MYHRASWSSSPSLPARSDDDYLPTGYDLPTRTSQGQKGDERDTGDKLNQGHIGSVFAILAATDSDVTYKVDNQAINQRAKALDEELMNKYSDEINRYLETANGRKRESIPWIDCPTSTLEEVENYVNLKFDHPTASFEGQGSDSLEALIEGSGSGLPEPVIESSGSGSPKTIIEASDYALPVSDDDDWYPVRPVRHEAIYLERGYKKWHSEDLKSYFEAAKTILAIFYPLGYTNSVTAKYWGAINRHLRWSKNRGLGMTDLLRDTHLVARTCKKIVHDLFIKHDCTAVEIPKEFLEAWIQCLMHFFLLSVPKARRSTQHLLSCMTLLKRGKRKVLQGLYTGQLQRRGVVSPTGIACVLISSLPSPGLHGLIDTYWTPLQKLTSIQTSNVFSLQYYTDYQNFKTEFETIISTLQRVQSTLFDLDEGLLKANAKSFIENEYWSTKESVVIQSALWSASQAETQVDLMLKDLNAWHLHLVETDKNRQEKAALTFTTVSVVFLPMTMIASVFGMNTNDIRNMNQQQGLFWVVALPTCLIAILLWLAYLGTLSVWIRGLQGRFSKNKAKNKTKKKGRLDGINRQTPANPKLLILTFESVPLGVADEAARLFLA